MSITEIISSGLLESYVLGTTSADENLMIHDLCKKHPELLKEIETIEEALISYASSNNQPLKDSVKQNIQSKLDLAVDHSSPSAKIVPLQSSVSSVKYYKYGIAASVILLIGSGAYILNLHQKLDKLNGEIAELTTTKSFLADELKIQQASLSDVNNKFNILSNPKVKTIALTGMNSLNDKTALVHWNQETNEVYFNATSLAPPANKQYQLWAIIDGKPVDAGVIDLQNSTAFQKMKEIKGAKAFAVTIENIGGSATPTLNTMCFLGNV